MLTISAFLRISGGKVWAETPAGEKISVAADKVLLSIGRRANYMGIGLETIGVEEYDPVEIIKKTEGRMAEDEQWIRIEVLA